MENKTDNKRRNLLTHSEIESLPKAADAGSHTARNYCPTLLCFVHGPRASEICRLRIPDIGLKAGCIYIHRLRKGLSATHPLLNKEVQALENWSNIRISYPHVENEWAFSSRRENPLSRQQFYRITLTPGDNAGLSLGAHLHMLHHSCDFASANMGIDTRLIQDYLGCRNTRHIVWHTVSNAGRFYNIWDKTRGRQRHAVLQR